LRKRMIIGIVLAAVVLVAGSGAVWILKFAPLSTNQLSASTVGTPYAVHRSEEEPLSAHRAVSMAATQAPTSLLPWGTAYDKLHGYFWVAEPGCEPVPKCPAPIPGVLGQYALSDGSFLQDFTEPTGYSSPLFVAVGADGHVWFTQPNSDALGEFDPQTMTWQTWPLKNDGGDPYDLVFDTSGNIWFTELAGNDIGFFNTRTHTMVENPVPTPKSEPYGITLDPHGNVWFAENGVGINQLGSFTPTPSGTVKITEHAVDAGQRPHLITADKAGNIWYSSGFTGTVGKYNPAIGTNTNFLVYTGGTCKNILTCTGTHISSVLADNQGNVWFTDSLSQQVGYLIPSTGRVVARTLKANSHPHDGLLLDNSNRVWFTEQDTLALVMWPVSDVR
jgi:virginiamycin B lyase